MKKEYILDPKNKNKSVILTEKRFKLSEQLFDTYFGLDPPEDGWMNCDIIAILELVSDTT